MGIPVFLLPALPIRSSSQFPHFTRFPKSHRFSICTATAISPSTDLRNSAQFLRHHWHNAIARTAPLFQTTTVIDATAGRGSDSIALGRILGSTGVIYACDIQKRAIEETHTRYSQASEENPMARLHLHNSSHADLSILGLPAASVSVIAYNLGWCPGRDVDRSCVTTIATTLSSLAGAEQLVAAGGLISVMAYVGHPGGSEEEQAVIDWSAKLCKKMWNVSLITYPNRENAPSLLLCERVS